MLGRGTPDDPGSDYGLVCAIEADTETQALEWGRRVHSDFQIARTMYTKSPSDGRLFRDGEIEGEVDLAELLREDTHYAVCAVGELPDWIEPWRGCKADGVRPPNQPWKPKVGG